MLIYQVQRLSVTGTDGGDSWKITNAWVNEHEYNNLHFAKDHYDKVTKEEPKITRRLVQVNTVVLESHSRGKS